MHHPTDRIAHTTAFATPVVEHWLEREIAQWVHTMKDRSDDPSHHERTLLPRSYTSLLCGWDARVGWVFVCNISYHDALPHTIPAATQMSDITNGPSHDCLSVHLFILRCIQHINGYIDFLII